MNRIILTCLLPLFFINAGRAQVLEKKAEEFKTHYNSKAYPQIYAMLNPEFSKTISEADFTKFLSSQLYLNFGQIKSFEFNTNENKNSFVAFFQKGKLMVTMKVENDSSISFLEFLPYYEAPRKKRSDYLSDNKKTSALDTVVERLVSSYIQSPENCGLSIGVSVNNQSFFYNYGTLNRSANVITGKETVYEIGSLSKVFCGVLFAQAVLEKKVNPDDDIRKYLPLGNYANLERRGAPVRLIHLANHTSGLPRIPDDIELQNDYDPSDPYKNYSREMVYNFLKKVDLDAEPGKRHEYSNIGMALLGIILEKVYNQSFDQLVKEKIAGPFEMKNTFVTAQSNSTSHLAMGYNSLGQETPYWNMNDLSAAGGIKSSTADLLSFLNASLNAANNSQNSVNALSLAATPTFTSGNTIGMGWHIIKTKQGNTLTWHNGGTFGFSGFMGFVKEKNCAVVILSNSGNMVDYIALGILKHLQK